MNQFPSFKTDDLDSFPKRLQTKLTCYLESINTLLSTKQKWTWENLIAPLETISDEIERFFSPISHLHAVMHDEALRRCYEACLPILTEYETHLGHHRVLCDAIASIDLNTVDQTQKKVIQDMLLHFKLAGVFLTETKQQRFKLIQEEMAQLSNTFETHVLDCENQYQYWVHSETQLTGLPQHAIETAKHVAESEGKEGWCLTLAYPCYLAVMTYAEDRALRKELYHAYQTRASEIGPHDRSFDNTSIMHALLEKRTEEALLLGFKNYAELSLATKMASSSEEVTHFLEDLSKRVKEKARLEYLSLKEYGQKLLGLNDIEAWDVGYLSQKMKQSLFAISDEALRPYFPLNHVLSAIQTLIQTLFGVSLQKITQETWHPDVECYELVDEKNATRGYLYMDLFARPNKRNGAWMDSLQSKRKRTDGAIQYPIAALTCNFAKTAKNSPPTLSHDELITLLHELGHCLHHTLTKIETHSATGTHGVEWDAVELPSQFLENWGWQREMLRTLSSHVETRECLPEELITQLLESRNFQAGLSLIRQIQFARFDFELHQTTEKSEDRIEKTLKTVRQDTQIIPLSPSNRFQNSFSHIFAGGYAAGYYSYLWAEVLSCDAFSRFEEEAPHYAKTGRDFLHCILEVGGSRRASESFLCFRKRPAHIDAFLKSHGMIEKDA